MPYMHDSLTGQNIWYDYSNNPNQPQQVSTPSTSTPAASPIAPPTYTDPPAPPSIPASTTSPSTTIINNTIPQPAATPSPRLMGSGAQVTHDPWQIQYGKFIP